MSHNSREQPSCPRRMLNFHDFIMLYSILREICCQPVSSLYHNVLSDAYVLNGARHARTALDKATQPYTRRSSEWVVFPKVAPGNMAEAYERE